MRIFCHAAEHNDCIEVRLLVDEPDRLVHGRFLQVGEEHRRGGSMVIGTIHCGDLWELNDMFPDDSDSATARQQAYVTGLVESFLAAHRLETVSVRPGSWAELDGMAASIIEAGPPWAYTVPVRTMRGAPEVRLGY